jgi:nicotianamine synthase
LSSVAVPSTIPALYRTLASFDSYAPSPEMNRLFGRLVDLVLSGSGSIGLGKSAVRDLRDICATAEYRLECHWSARIAASDAPCATLARFPYSENYQRLAVMEHEGLLATGASVPGRAAFVGGGPLPLSALRLADYGWSGTVIDHDPAAVALARALVSSLDVDLSVRFADGAAVDYADHDLIHVAALVGGAEGDGVFERIEATAATGTTLLARSVHGRRRLLYSPLPEDTFGRFCHLQTVQPPADIINSAVYFRV